MARLARRLQFDYYVGGLLHVLLKPFVVALGRLLHRNHDLADRRGPVTFLKLMGGGSLAIAYPSLLAIRNAGWRLRLVATEKTRAFGESLGVFDDIIVIRDGSVATLVWDSFRAIVRLFRTDTIVDLEIHSRLSTVFCLATCARNRIGFYTHQSFWRRDLSTHLLFHSVSRPVHLSYDRLAALFGAGPVAFADAAKSLRVALNAEALGPADDGVRRIGVAPCCSELSPERMLSEAQWSRVVAEKVGRSGADAELHLFGGPGDAEYLDALGRALAVGHPAVRVVNHGGRLSLTASVRLIAGMHEILAIDSALLHYARLLAVPSTSFWGPTDPSTLLRPSDLAAETIRYARLSCSPCVHVATHPPCQGRNICMEFAVEMPERADQLNPVWLA